MLLIVFIAADVVMLRHKQRGVLFIFDLVEPFIKYLNNRVVAVNPVFQASFTGIDDSFAADFPGVV